MRFDMNIKTLAYEWLSTLIAVICSLLIACVKMMFDFRYHLVSQESIFISNIVMERQIPMVRLEVFTIFSDGEMVPFQKHLKYK